MWAGLHRTLNTVQTNSLKFQAPCYLSCEGGIRSSDFKYEWKAISVWMPILYISIATIWLKPMYRPRQVWTMAAKLITLHLSQVLKLIIFFLNCINSSILKFQFFSIITGFYSRLNLLQAAGSTIYLLDFWVYITSRKSKSVQWQFTLIMSLWRYLYIFTLSMTYLVR